MGNIELTLRNPFVTRSPRSDRKSSVFTRAYTQLAVNKRNPGQVVPIFIRIDDDYKIFGVLTLNVGGSVSFFPDFYNLENFDHLTLSADFIRKKGHSTKVESDGTRQRLIHFEASPLVGSDYYHLITFGMDSGDLLMDALPEIELPVISYTTEEERQKYQAWIESSAHGQCVLNFPKEDGARFVQILILPKGKSSVGVAVERGVVQKLLVSQTSFEGKLFNCKKIEIPTPGKSDFSICILAFRAPGKVQGSFGFLMAQNPAKPYPTPK